MSDFDPWEAMSEMAHEARDNGGAAFAFRIPNEDDLKLWRQGPITRFFVGAQEVAAPVFALELCRQQSVRRQIEAGADASDLPAMPADFYDEHGVHLKFNAGLTKREYAEIHVLAGALNKIADAYEAVDYAKLAVSILIDEWTERDTNA